jgi:hypothetical protein
VDNRCITRADDFIHTMCTGRGLEVHRNQSGFFRDKQLIYKAIIKLFTAIIVLNNYSNLIISNNY